MILKRENQSLHNLRSDLFRTIWKLNCFKLRTWKTGKRKNKELFGRQGAPTLKRRNNSLSCELKFNGIFSSQLFVYPFQYSQSKITRAEKIYLKRCSQFAISINLSVKSKIKWVKHRIIRSNLKNYPLTDLVHFHIRKSCITRCEKG